MADLSDFRIPALVDAPQEQSVGDIYFKATSVTNQPVLFGSDEAFEVANNPITGGGGGGSVNPFQLVKTGATSVKIAYGTVNSVSPDDVAVDIDDATEFNVSGTNYFWLDVTFDGNDGSVEAVEITVRSSGYPPSSTVTEGYLLIGVVVESGSSITAISQNVSGSQSVASCGTVHYFGRI